MTFPKPLFLLILLLSFTKCETVDFDTTDDQPVFETNLTVNGEAYQISAGVEDYTMFTDHLEIGPLTYRGTFVKRDSEGNISLLNPEPPLLTISLRKSETVNNSLVPDHTQGVEDGAVTYTTRDNQLISSEVMFNGEYNGTSEAQSYLWDFGDSESIDFKSPVHSYPNVEAYNASLVIIDQNGCSATSSNTINFEDQNYCFATIDTSNHDENTVTLVASSAGTAPVTYQWSNGELSDRLNVNLQELSAGFEQYCVTITDSDGCVSNTCISLRYTESGQSLDYCTSSMTIDHFNIFGASPQFNSVQVDWMPEQGREFTSFDLQQPGDSFFEISNVEEFERNENGQKTLKFDFEMKCTVWEASLGINPQVIEGSGTIAVGLPE